MKSIYKAIRNKASNSNTSNTATMFYWSVCKAVCKAVRQYVKQHENKLNHIDLSVSKTVSMLC